MDRTKAAEILHKAKVCYATEYLDCHMVCDMCKYHVEDSLVVEAIDTAIKALDKDIDVPTKWIPVSERLPEEKINPNTYDFEEVLCSTTFGDVRAYKFGSPREGEEPHFWHGPEKIDKYVLAWMPLPEPYKEGEWKC